MVTTSFIIHRGTVVPWYPIGFNPIGPMSLTYHGTMVFAVWGLVLGVIRYWRRGLLIAPRGYNKQHTTHIA